MPSQQHYLSLEDLRLARDPDYLLTLFRKLAYRVEAELIPLDPAELKRPDRAGIQRCFLLADHAHPPDLQVLLGLYRFRRESTPKFKNCASGTAGIFAEAVVDARKEGSPGKADVKVVGAFIEDELFGWEARMV